MQGRDHSHQNFSALYSLSTVLAPTRELAVQIQQEAAEVGSSSKIKNTCMNGGGSKGTASRRPPERPVKLLEDIMDGSRILILVDTKKGRDQITRQLRMDGWPALSVHGDKSQAERDWVLSEFKAGKSPIMTATDVAARRLANARFAKELVSILEEAGQKVSPDLAAMGRGAPPPPPGQGHGGYRDRGRGFSGGRSWN